MKWQTRTRSICTSLCFGMNSTFTMPCTFDKQQQEPPRNVRWKTKKLFGFAFVPELCSLVFAYWTERHNTRHRKTNFRLSHIHKQRAADAFACPVAVFFFTFLPLLGTSTELIIWRLNARYTTNANVAAHIYTHFSIAIAWQQQVHGCQSSTEPKEAFL